MADNREDAAQGIGKGAFRRLVREIGKEHMQGIRFRQQAVLALREVTEDLVDLFKAAHLAATHAKRVNIRPSDMTLVRKIRGEIKNPFIPTKRMKLLLKLPFQRLVREIGQKQMQGIRFQQEAMSALQAATEDHLVDLFKATQLAATHAKRVNIKPSDMTLVHKIKGRIYTNGDPSNRRRRRRGNSEDENPNDEEPVVVPMEVASIDDQAENYDDRNSRDARIVNNVEKNSNDEEYDYDDDNPLNARIVNNMEENSNDEEPMELDSIDDQAENCEMETNNPELRMRRTEEISRVCPQVILRQEDKVSLKNFVVHGELGSGGFGTVYLVSKKDGKDNIQFAMKKIEKQKVTDTIKSARLAKTERIILETIRGIPFLMQMHYAFQTHGALYLVLDYIGGGELRSYLPILNVDAARFYMAEVIIAIGQLHRMSFIHRDIKAKNVLMDSEGHIVVTDFGLSRLLNTSPLDTCCGTVYAMAPEVIRGDQPPSVAIDWWAVGILCYEILTNNIPYNVPAHLQGQEFTRALYAKISEEPPDLSCIIHPEAKDFLSKILEKDLTVRLVCGAAKTDEIKAHPFFKSIKWDKMAEKKINTPIKPKVRHLQYDPNAANHSIVDAPVNVQQCFRGFSYVSPEYFN